jgi:hypothetical protein
LAKPKWNPESKRALDYIYERKNIKQGGNEDTRSRGTAKLSLLLPKNINSVNTDVSEEKC